MIKRESFEWVSGKEFAEEYIPEDPFTYKRCFCKKCGTSLGEILSAENEFPIAANCLDTDPNVKVWFHEHVASKPSWQLTHDGVKLFDGNPHK